jgi:hypothetical protein
MTHAFILLLGWRLMMTRQHIKPAIIPSHLLIKDKNNRRRRFYDVTARVFMHLSSNTTNNSRQSVIYQIPLFYFYYFKIS